MEKADVQRNLVYLMKQNDNLIAEILSYTTQMTGLAIALNIGDVQGKTMDQVLTTKLRQLKEYQRYLQNNIDNLKMYQENNKELLSEEPAVNPW